MNRKVALSATFVRQFRKSTKADRDRVRAAVELVAEDATTKRSGADIKRLTKTTPVKHRIRIGRLRVIYKIDRKTIHVIEMFSRGRGYREK